MTTASYTFEVQGMTCNHCVRAVKSALEEVSGVSSAEVRIGHVEVQATEEGLQDRLVAAIEEEGYQVTGTSGAPGA